MNSIAVSETDGSSLVAVRRGDLDLNRDQKAAELAIADNGIGELGLEWNPEVLASLGADLAQFRGGMKHHLRASKIAMTFAMTVAFASSLEKVCSNLVPFLLKLSYCAASGR